MAYNPKENKIIERKIELKVREEFSYYKDVIEIEGKIYMFGHTHIHTINKSDSSIDIIKNKGTYKT